MQYPSDAANFRTTMTDFPLNAVRRLLAQTDGFSGADGVEPMADTGLAHWHARIVGRGLVVRAPKQSQMRLGAADNLAYQAACFGAAEPSRATPKLFGTLPPQADLPLGALIVEEIAGRPPRLPGDLPAIAGALAAIHDCPDSELRKSLFHPPAPLRAMIEEIDAQAVHLTGAALSATVETAIEAERRLAHNGIAAAAAPPTTLISFDAHPGNFLIRDDGSAILVDLEKARISLPGFDLAHATLYTSTTWDPAVFAVLEPAESAAFYDDWSVALGSAAELYRPYHQLTRRLMWLWSVTWCAKWRCTSGRAQRRDEALADNAEDWSAQKSESALIDHVRDRVDDYLSAPAVDRVRADIAEHSFE